MDFVLPMKEAKAHVRRSIEKAATHIQTTILNDEEEGHITVDGHANYQIASITLEEEILTLGRDTNEGKWIRTLHRLMLSTNYENLNLNALRALLLALQDALRENTDPIEAETELLKHGFRSFPE